MNLPRAALRAPFTVIVLVMALALASIMAWWRMPKDIFPALNLPTIYVAQSYGGMDPAQMEGYLVYFYEYHFLYLTGIEHVESKSIQGTALMKLQFHPGTDMSQAMAETVAYVNRARAFMPPGTVPPLITRFDAGSVPIGYLVFSSDTHSITEMQDAALNRVRPLLATIAGASAPPPFGGNARTIVARLKPERLKSYGISPQEVVAALTEANVVSPSGNLVKSGKYPLVPVNSIPRNIKDLEAAPVRGGQYPAVFVRDVAEVEDDSDIVTCYALVNGRRTVYVPITKRAEASTLSVARAVKESVPRFQAVLPPGMKVTYMLDRSSMVMRALKELPWEGGLGAVLTGLTVFTFLRNGRSALVVVANIPVALMAAVLCLWASGQTLSLMTLGGLALAVGVLVDEATVCIENIHVHLAKGDPVARAVLDATAETTGPRLLSMLCVLVMFAPALFMTGAAKALFLPLALAVGFAMGASYLLSSTLVPVMTIWTANPQPTSAGEELWVRFQVVYGRLLKKMGGSGSWLLLAYFGVTTALVLLVGRGLGAEIFPAVKSDEIQVRLRAAAGTDIEGTEAALLTALQVVTNVVGADSVGSTLGFVGLHGSSYPINFLYLWDGGTEEGVLQVQLRGYPRKRRERLDEELRKELRSKVPWVSFCFEPADLVSRIMSLGATSPIEVAVSGPNLASDRAFAEKVKVSLEAIPTLCDVQFAQSLDYPTVEVEVDRERAGIIGPSMNRISRALIPATWSSRFEVANYWADPDSGVAYQMQAQIPQRLMTSLEDLGNLTIGKTTNHESILLRNVGRVKEGTAWSEYDRYNMQRTLTVRANLAGEDLSSAAGRVRKALEKLGPPPKRVSVGLRGQVPAMKEIQEGLLRGLIVATVTIFLMLAANFQSWKLALVVMSTVPAVLAGAVVSLWMTRTTLNVQSLIGLIMALGIAMANAVLLVTCAERHRILGASATVAASEGATSRLRPILMTSLTMVAGMLPVALGISDRSGQMAALACAVLGGLAAATLATLLVLPATFAMVQKNSLRRDVSLLPGDRDGISGANMA